MCIGIPLQVIECEEQTAICGAGGRRERLNIVLVGPQAVGTWLLAYQGSAIRVLTEDEALQTRAALAALDAAMTGVDDLDVYFADLAAREPSLPPHLRPSRTETPE
jgi:hydrogenase expression/formation protein HypC